MTRAVWRAVLANPALPIAAYLGLVGVASLLEGGLTPDTLQAALPTWLVDAWTLALAVGGILAVSGCLMRRSRVESAGLALLIFGTGLYGVVVSVAIWPVGVTAAAAIFALVTSCAIRMRILTQSRRAQQEAGRILGGEV